MTLRTAESVPFRIAVSWHPRKRGVGVSPRGCPRERARWAEGPREPPAGAGGRRRVGARREGFGAAASRGGGAERSPGRGSGEGRPGRGTPMAD